MRIYDFNPVIKEEAEMSDVVTAHGLVNKALNNPASRQEYFNFMTYLRDKHGKEYSTRVHQKAVELTKPVTEDAWHGENPAWHNGNDQWHDGTDQWHSPDSDSTGGGAISGGGAVGATSNIKGAVDLDVDVDSNKQATDVEVVDTSIQQTSNTKETD